MSILQKHYSVTEDWEGERYIGMLPLVGTEGGKVHVTMPGCVARALSEFQHKTQRKEKDVPYDTAPRKYGAASQEVDAPITSSPISKINHQFIQKVTENVMYIEHSVDTMLLIPLSAMASK